jgi:hypothetical protein
MLCVRRGFILRADRECHEMSADRRVGWHGEVLRRVNYRLPANLGSAPQLVRSVLKVGDLSCQGGAAWSVVIDGHQPAMVSADHREVPWRSDPDVAANAAGQPSLHCVVLRGVEDAAKAGVRPVRGSKLGGRVGQR